MNKALEQWKAQYENTPIPEGLEFVVKKALREGERIGKYRRNTWKWIRVAAVIITILTIGVNTSPIIANALSEVPVLKNVIRVLTFREFTVNEGTFHADLQVPQITGLESKEFETLLNAKYYEENKRLYDQFVIEMEKLKTYGGGHLGIDSGYVVKTDNEQILVIGRYYVNIVGSSSTIFKYDTIDKHNQILITLPSLFKDESYIEQISENIKEQMRQQVKIDSTKTYFLPAAGMETPITCFESIDPEQNFYINSTGKLVISFNKYEIAPGYMGVVEFEIPTEVVANLLVSDEYVK